MALSKKPKTTDDLSFKEAFKIFRKKHGGDGGKFKWKGKVYTTDLDKSSAPATSKRPQARTPPTTDSGPSKRPSLKSTGRTEANMSYGPQPQPKKPSRSIGSGWIGTKKTPRKKTYK
jgi:hypothetical protein